MISRHEFKHQEKNMPPEHRCNELNETQITEKFSARVFAIIDDVIDGEQQWVAKLFIIDEEHNVTCNVMIDHCPFCGLELSNEVKLLTTTVAKITVPIQKEYFEYRKRYVKEGHTGTTLAPLSLERWQEVTEEWDQTVKMRTEAKQDHQQVLEDDLEKICKLLCLPLLESSTKGSQILENLHDDPNSPESQD